MIQKAKNSNASLRAPKYRHYRPKNLGVVRIEGRDIYLGTYDSPESRAKYHRIVAEWMANPQRAVSPAEPASTTRAVAPRAPISINEVALAYLEFATGYYRANRDTTSEVSCLKYALKPLCDQYGTTAATGFGPKALKALRQFFIDQGHCRNQVNRRVYLVRRMFKWAASEELIPVSVYEALRTVEGLKRGRSNARESEPVRPVSMQHVDATLPYVAPQVAAMILIQRFTGMRPGEVVIMRGSDIEQSGTTWFYRPSKHKTEYLIGEKVIPLGPKAIEILKPFLNRSSESYLFSPAEAEDARNAARMKRLGSTRKTKAYPSELRARERRHAASKRRKALRPKRDRYDVASYRRAIEYGIRKANNSNLVIPHWHPHQLRHTRATEIRSRYGIEGAQVSLGHQTADVTQVYAERNLALATRIAQETG